MPQTPVPPVRAATRRRHWGRDLTEVAALFAAMATADLIADLVNHGPDGGLLLMTSAGALLAAAGTHLWWTRRPARTAGASVLEPAADTAPDAEPALWRLRTTVRDTPGSLGAV